MGELLRIDFDHSAPVRRGLVRISGDVAEFQSAEGRSWCGLTPLASLIVRLCVSYSQRVINSRVLWRV